MSAQNSLKAGNNPLEPPKVPLDFANDPLDPQRVPATGAQTARRRFLHHGDHSLRPFLPSNSISASPYIVYVPLYSFSLVSTYFSTRE